MRLKIRLKGRLGRLVSPSFLELPDHQSGGDGERCTRYHFRDGIGNRRRQGDNPIGISSRRLANVSAVSGRCEGLCKTLPIERRHFSVIGKPCPAAITDGRRLAS
ncbi:MAG: hypothetical protein WKF84_14245 [Pyrinomonadaceae bacterium]